MDDSEGFLRTKTLEIANEWGFKSNHIRETEEFNATTASSPVSIFGETTITHLNLTDANKLRAFVKVIEDSKKTGLLEGNWFGSGVIITTTHARGAKKIEDLVKKHKGKVVKKAKPEEARKRLLDEVNLNANVRKLIEDHVGEDYSMLVSPITEIKKWDAARQKNLTFDEFLVMLPVQPGAVKPFEFLTPMLEGRTNEALESFRRAMINSHVLVAMITAKNRIEQMYRLKVLQLNGITDSKEQARILGIKNSGSVWYAFKSVRNLSPDVVEYIAKLTFKTENELKGGLNVDSNTHFEAYISKVSTSIKYNRIVG